MRNIKVQQFVTVVIISSYVKNFKLKQYYLGMPQFVSGIYNSLGNNTKYFTQKGIEIYFRLYN